MRLNVIDTIKILPVLIIGVIINLVMIFLTLDFGLASESQDEKPNELIYEDKEFEDGFL